jgi:2-hydroxychromene-2-carboxylate isomerase
MIDVYFDLLSPYSYFAVKTLPLYAWAKHVILKPVSLAKVMIESRNTPPGACPSKQAYMGQDLSRLAQYYQVPFKFDAKKFPFSSKLGNAAIACLAPENRLKAATALYDRCYGRGDFDFLQNSEEVHRELDGLDLPADFEQRGHELVQSNSTEALQRGAFGVPTFFDHDKDQNDPIVGKLYWGCDRMHLVSKV